MFINTLYIPVFTHVYIPVFTHVYIPVFTHVYIPVYTHVHQYCVALFPGLPLPPSPNIMWEEKRKKKNMAW